MIKLYLFRIPNKTLPTNLLPQKYLDRIKSIKNKQAYKEAVASRLLLRYALIKNKAHKNILNQITYSPNGKPIIEGYYFNISHSNKYVVCCLDNKPIGVDMEKINPRFKTIAQNFLSKQEQKTNPNIIDLTKIWTQKEATIKLNGGALSFKINKIKIDDKKVKSLKWKNFYISICSLEKLLSFPKLEIVKKIL